jgi:hypothetical protein
MSNSFKQQITAELQKAKNAGGVRVERIRKILQDAASQTVSELKEGTGELRSIAKDSTTTLIETLKDKPQTSTQEVHTPVEVVIESADEPESLATLEVVTLEQPPATPVQLLGPAEDPIVAVSPVPVSPVAVSPVTASPVTASPIPEVLETPVEIAVAISEPTTQADQQSATEAEAATSTFVDSLKALIEQVRQSEAYAKLKRQFATIDTNLSARYGERYEAFKQEFNQDMQKAKIWYDGQRVNADATGSNWLERKQAEFEVKMSEAGATIASKEQKIKYLLKELWQTVTKS